MTDQESMFQKTAISQDAEQELTTEQLEGVVTAGGCWDKVKSTIGAFAKRYCNVKRGISDLGTPSSSKRRSIARTLSSSSSSSKSSLGSGEHKVLGWNDRGNPVLHGSTSNSK